MLACKGDRSYNSRNEIGHLAQLVEHSIHIGKVGGPSPSVATLNTYTNCKISKRIVKDFKNLMNLYNTLSEQTLSPSSNP